MVRMGRPAATARVSSRLPSSTSSTSSTASGGIASHVSASVRAALYAGMATRTRVSGSADVEELLAHGVDDRLHPRMQVQLLEDVAHVVLDRVLGDVEVLGDLAVAHALGHELQHLELAVGEPGGGELLLLLGPLHQRVELGEELGGHRRRDQAL